LITDPVYDSNVGDYNAVCVTKNSSSVSLWKVRLKVDEALSYDTDIKVDANGTEDWDESSSVTFSGKTSGEASLGITGNIINEVDVYNNNFQIDWQYKVHGGTDTYYPINTTNHTVYVKYNDPTGGHSLTEHRIAWLCDECNGNINPTQCSDDIYAGLAGATPEFALSGADNPSNKWHMMDPNGPTGDCHNLSMLMQDMHQLLGCGDGEIGYVFSTKDINDTDVYSTISTDNETRTCPGGVHGTEKSRFYAFGDWNNYEGVFHVNGYYYAVKETKRGVAFNVLKDILGINSLGGNYQGWRYIDGGWNTCTSPGPCPIPLHAAIPE